MSPLDLIEELWEDGDLLKRCPFLFKSERGRCDCLSPLNRGNSPVGHFDLQLWCLDGESRYKMCCFHPEYPRNENHARSGDGNGLPGLFDPMESL